MKYSSFSKIEGRLLHLCLFSQALALAKEEARSVQSSQAFRGLLHRILEALVDLVGGPLV